MAAADLSRLYVEAHNSQDLDRLIALVADEIDFKRPDDPVLTSREQVREQYSQDWSTHHEVHVGILRLLESGSTVIAEIEVDAGPPSHAWYRGVVIHDWNEDGRLKRYRLYVGDTERPDAPSPGSAVSPLTTGRELRLVVTVTDFDRALAIYRDALGLVQVEDYSTSTRRAVVLDAGRATIELADAAHAEYVDEVEVGRRTAGTIRLAFEVADAGAVTRAAVDAGATLVAGPALTPWETSSSRLESGEGFQLTLFGKAWSASE